MRYLSSEELAAFREHCPQEWRPLLMLLFSIGMTISEALGLRRSDIDTRTRRVSIHEEYGRTLKRESRARELSIPASVVSLLVVHLEGIPESLTLRFFRSRTGPPGRPGVACAKRQGSWLRPFTTRDTPSPFTPSRVAFPRHACRSCSVTPIRARRAVTRCTRRNSSRMLMPIAWRATWDSQPRHFDLERQA